MSSPCLNCKRRYCPSVCFPKEDYIRHLLKKCSQRQIENELETIRRAVAAMNVRRAATGAANAIRNGASSSTSRTSESETRESRP